MSDQGNYTPLTPQSFLRRSYRVYPEKTAVISGERRFTYRELYQRVCRQANALRSLGMEAGTQVAVLAPNTPEHLEACYGVQMGGGVLVALNYRLSPREIAFILNHCEARILIVDQEFLPSLEPVREESK